MKKKVEKLTIKNVKWLVFHVFSSLYRSCMGAGNY